MTLLATVHKAKRAHDNETYFAGMAQLEMILSCADHVTVKIYFRKRKVINILRKG